MRHGDNKTASQPASCCHPIFCGNYEVTELLHAHEDARAFLYRKGKRYEAYAHVLHEVIIVILTSSYLFMWMPCLSRWVSLRHSVLLGPSRQRKVPNSGLQHGRLRGPSLASDLGCSNFHEGHWLTQPRNAATQAR